LYIKVIKCLKNKEQQESDSKNEEKDFGTKKFFKFNGKFYFSGILFKIKLVLARFF